MLKKITLKIQNLNEFNYKSKKVYIHICVFNIAMMCIFNLELCLHSKILIESGRKIILNPKFIEFDEKFGFNILNLYNNIKNNVNFIYGAPKNSLEILKNRNFIYLSSCPWSLKMRCTYGQSDVVHFHRNFSILWANERYRSIPILYRRAK